MEMILKDIHLFIIDERNLNNIKFKDDTILMTDSERKLKIKQSSKRNQEEQTK